MVPFLLQLCTYAISGKASNNPTTVRFMPCFLVRFMRIPDGAGPAAR